MTSQQIRQLAVDPVEQGGTQKQLLDLGRLAFQHLGEEILGHGPAAPGEFCDKSFGVRAAGQGDRGEPQASGPAFRPLVQLRGLGFRQRDAGSLEEFAGLVLSKTQVRRADLGQLAGETKLVQPEWQITARCKDRVHMPGEFLKQPGQLYERFRRGQLVQIIDDEESAIAMLGELRQNSLADGRFIEVGCRCHLFTIAGRAGGLPDGAEDGKPELLRVLLIASHLHNCQPI